MTRTISGSGGADWIVSVTRSPETTERPGVSGCTALSQAASVTMSARGNARTRDMSDESIEGSDARERGDDEPEADVAFAPQLRLAAADLPPSFPAAHAADERRLQAPGRRRHADRR